MEIWRQEPFLLHLRGPVPNFAEGLRGLKKDLKEGNFELACVKAGWTHIILEGDCIVVVNALNDRHGENLRPFGVIISACRVFFPYFTALEFSFIRCTGNGLAHALSHLAIDFGVVFGVSPPTDLALLI